MTLKAVVTVLGALAEFGALLLVVGDFYEARKQADAILRPPGRRVVAAWRIDYDIDPEGIPPEERDRVAKERQAERERMEAQARKAAVVAALAPPGWDQIEAGVSSETHLRESLASAWRGSAARKWTAVLLLAVGISLSALANLL